jgi:hypothetical protein
MWAESEARAPGGEHGSLARAGERTISHDVLACAQSGGRVTISTALFARAGIRLGEREVEALVIEALERILPPRPAPSPGAELTAEEQAALRRAGVNLEPTPAGQRALARSAAAYAALVASSLSVPQAAARLGVDASRVRHRLAERTLYGIRQRSGWRLPAFQFIDRGLVPGIDRVLPGLPAGLDPLGTVNWFLLPHSDLYDPGDPGETPISPLDWLRSGRDPRPVAELAAAEDEGA